LIGSGSERGSVSTSPPNESIDVDGVWWLVPVGLNMVDAAPEQGDRAGHVASGGTGGPHGQLGQALHKRAAPRETFPGFVLYFVHVERHAVVEQALGLSKGLVR
jgi:hypothetical protein